jgi:DNA-binding CsgD family transcriptional regulator
MHTGSAPAIALLLSDPGSRTMVTAQSLRAVFDLTPAEAAIAAALANGMSVSDTAAHLGVALNTVRTHLRSIFSKTGVSRQSQLVHLIHTRVRPQERSNEEIARA